MLSDEVMESLTLSMDSAYKSGMELTVMERLLLLQLLPKEGNFLTLKMVRKLREDLSFDEREHEILKFVTKEAQGQVTWSNDNLVLKEVEIPAPMMDIIVEALQKLDADSKLTMETAALYERFLPVPEAVVT